MRFNKKAIIPTEVTNELAEETGIHVVMVAYLLVVIR